MFYLGYKFDNASLKRHREEAWPNFKNFNFLICEMNTIYLPETKTWRAVLCTWEIGMDIKALWLDPIWIRLLYHIWKIALWCFEKILLYLSKFRTRCQELQNLITADSDSVDNLAKTASIIFCKYITWKIWTWCQFFHVRIKESKMFV